LLGFLIGAVIALYDFAFHIRGAGCVSRNRAYNPVNTRRRGPPTNKKRRFALEFLFVLIPVAIVAFIAFAVIASGLSSKCPGCGKLWGLKELERREISRESGMKWVTRTETHHDSQGHSSQVQRQVQVSVMRIKYDGSFRCIACGHSVRKEFVEEKESW
jgi:hypothetical protein